MRSSLYAATGLRATFRCVALSVCLMGLNALADGDMPPPPPPPQTDQLPPPPPPPDQQKSGLVVPDFKGGGFLFDIQYGYSVWSMNVPRINAATGEHLVDPFGNKPAHMLTLGLAYNILGHVSVGADITASGWDVFSPSRGGGGFVVGKFAGHPLQAVFAAMKQDRKFGFDFNTFFGVGYGIAGFGPDADNKRGMDGLIFEWGLNADYFLARYFAIGIYVKGIFTSWDKYYLDFENRAQAGNTINLNPVSGGAVWSFGLTLTFRGGE